MFYFLINIKSALYQCSNIQFTQRGFYFFHLTIADKFYLARTIAGDSKGPVEVIVC